MTMRSTAAALLLALLGAFAPAQSFADDAAPQIIQAHPSLWRVHGEHGTVYLFGSIHLLPPHVNWHTPAVNRAMRRADVFVFEIPLDDNTMAQLKTLVLTHGTLPDGQSLRSLLPSESQTDFDKAMQYLHLPSAAINTKRPWLASLIMESIMLKARHQTSAQGVDPIMSGEAKDRGKELHYLETVDQQIKLIMPDDPAVELQSFEVDLKSILTEDQELGELTKAWEEGDAATLDRLTNQELKDHPQARAALFDNRNRAWVKQIEAMLSEHKTFFITVGAGHLVGENSVPALLRADGYKVDGP